jgi:hypothetical protein
MKYKSEAIGVQHGPLIPKRKLPFELLITPFSWHIIKVVVL